MNKVLLATILTLTAGVPFYKQDAEIDNQQKLPLIVQGLTRNGKPTDYNAPPTFTVDPIVAGSVAAGIFVPRDDFEGPVVIQADATNRKNEPITGKITINVSSAPAIALEVTAGPPIDK